MQYKEREEDKNRYIKLEGHRHFHTGQWVRQNYMELRNLFSDLIFMTPFLRTSASSVVYFLGI